jgi:predicted chitinase
MPTMEQLTKIFPDASKEELQKNVPLLAREMVAAGMISKSQLVALFCNVYTETRSFGSIPEVGKGGGEYGPFYGRGFIQLTHKENYQAMSKVLGQDLFGNPELALQPELAAKISVLFWTAKAANTIDIRPLAEKQDWPNCRSVINAGCLGGRCWGMEVYTPCVERALAVLTSGLDPNAVGSAMPAGYGMGCADPGGPVTTISGQGNPQSGQDAVLRALGLHLANLNRAITAEMDLDLYSQPEILKFEAQKAFDAKGFGGGEFDTSYTIDTVHFIADHVGGALEAHVVAHAGEELPPIKIFSNNAPSTATAMAGAGITPTSGTPTTGGEAGDGTISGKILANGMKAFQAGASTAEGPGGGNVACAWAVNKFCIVPSGLKPLGSNPDYVPSLEDELKGGRGKLVSRAEAIPGDIWIAPDQGHVGICVDKGCATVLSNSSSKASFTWKDAIDSVNSNYGGGAERIYRMQN